MRIIIIRIPFSIRNLDIELDKEWNKYRLKIFTDYTLRSIKAQINQKFIAVLKCREEMIDFIKKELLNLTDPPNNLMVMGTREYDSKIYKIIKDYKYLYEVRLDSDDLYHKDFINKLHSYNPDPGTEALISQNGYIYDIKTKRLASFFLLSPQSYVFIYKVKDFINGFYYKPKNGHGGVIKLKHELIPGYNYLDICHNKNTSSTFDYANKERQKWSKLEIRENVKSILEEFGIEGNNND